MNTENFKAKVLVVDDDLNLLDLLVDTLTTIGYSAVPAHGGVPALERLKDERFDLMVTDIRMPDLDGIQLLKKVRRHYPGMPVLFITGFAPPDMVGQASPDGLLAKPFRIAQIESLIEQTLVRKSSGTVYARPKVLVVDSDEAFRTNLAEALNFSNYIPFAAGGEQDALRELENGRFHAVIADTTLADDSGLDLGRKVKRLYPDTPVILIGTGNSPETDDADPVPFDRYVQKPFQVGTMIQLLESLGVSSAHEPY